MANTPLSEVYDLFLMTITDYRLNELFTTSETDFETYLQAWLEYAVVEFSICDQDLDFDETTKLFPCILTRENKVMLATLMMKYWMQKNVNDITQMNLHITDRDFRLASEAQNLREKVAHLNVVKEQCSQALVEYGFKKTTWTDWYNQTFGGE